MQLLSANHLVSGCILNHPCHISSLLNDRRPPRTSIRSVSCSRMYQPSALGLPFSMEVFALWKSSAIARRGTDQNKCRMEISTTELYVEPRFQIPTLAVIRNGQATSLASNFDFLKFRSRSKHLAHMALDFELNMFICVNETPRFNFRTSNAR